MRTAPTERIAFLAFAVGVIAALVLSLAPELAHAGTHALHHSKEMDARDVAALFGRAFARVLGGTT